MCLVEETKRRACRRRLVASIVQSCVPTNLSYPQVVYICMEARLCTLLATPSFSTTSPKMTEVTRGRERWDNAVDMTTRV